MRQPAGGALPGIAPSNAYPCQGDEYVLIAANGDAIFKRMMHAIGRADLAEDLGARADRRPREAGR
ncbi:CoA transferase [Cupriavidus basilensis]